MFRYNTDDAQFEGYTTEWVLCWVGRASTFNVDKISGDGTTSFTLGQSIMDENNTQVYIDGVINLKTTIPLMALQELYQLLQLNDNIEVVSVTRGFRGH